MKKDIKDYLHLYLRADYTCIPQHRLDGREEQVKIISLPLNGTEVEVAPMEYHGPEFYCFMHTLKPILRPLSDMTEEECIKANSLAGDGAFGADENLKAYYTRKAVFFEPEEFKYLLSIGIDLFGLIEAELAIDASTLKSIK